MCARVWLARLAGLFGRRRQDDQLTDDVRLHLEMAAEENRKRGMSSGDAAALARRQFGGVEQMKEQFRDQRGVPLLDGIFREIRLSMRSLRRRPTFAAVAILTLAVGIGVNTAVFSLVDAVLLRPLPYPDGDRLATLWQDLSRTGIGRVEATAADFRDWRASSETFQDMAGFFGNAFNLTGEGAPERLEGFEVTPNLFRVLRVEPILGRGFTENDAQGPGSPVSVTVLSHGLWQERFGGDRGIVGRSITLNGRAYEVVGVMPSRFQFPRDDVRLWTPFEPADDRNIYFLQVVGRLRPHASVREAQAEMDGIAARLRDEYPQSNLNREKTAVVPLRDYFVGERRASYWLLFGASGLVLLVAVANVAGLLITHGIQRRREIAIRTALGAGRLHVTRQLAVEGLTLSVTGGLFGTALAVGTFRYLEMLMPSGLSGAGAPALDLRLLAFSLAVVLVSGIIFSLAPLFRMQDSTGNAGLGARSTGYPSRSRARTALVVFQVALALVVVASTALLLRTVENLEAVDPGFRSENVLTARLEQFRTNDSIENRKRFYREVVERIERLPGVTAAGFTTFLPYTSTSGATFFVLEDRPDLATESSIAYRREVTPGYFAALGLPLLAGRVFDQNDDTDSPPVVVVSQYIADLLGGDAVGKRLGYLTAGNAPPSWMTIVGVVGEIRQESLDRPSERAVVYLPVAQSDRLWFFNPRDVVVRTPGDPLQLAAALRRAVWAVDPDQSVSNVRTLETLVGGQLSERRTIAFLFTTFSALVLVLAALGVYGLMAFVVASRAREFGLRMALGAERRDVARSVARQGALWIGSGVAAGLAGSLAVTQTLESLLYEVQPVDAVSLAAAIVALSTAGTVAALVPVWRATRVDPMTVLRFE